MNITITKSTANARVNTDAADDAITLTADAVAHVKKWIKKRGSGIGLRIGIKTRGCSGLAYVLDVIDERLSDDYKFEQEDDLQVFVDPKSYPFIKGLQVDYVRQGLNEGFKYFNPNEKGACGCGESFNV